MISSIDRTAQRYWEVARAWRRHLDLDGVENIQHALTTTGILITVELGTTHRPIRYRQLKYLHELNDEMIVGQRRNKVHV